MYQPLSKTRVVQWRKSAAVEYNQFLVDANKCKVGMYTGGASGVWWPLVRDGHKRPSSLSLLARHIVVVPLPVVVAEPDVLRRLHVARPCCRPLQPLHQRLERLRLAMAPI